MTEMPLYGVKMRSNNSKPYKTIKWLNKDRRYDALVDIITVERDGVSVPAIEVAILYRSDYSPGIRLIYYSIEQFLIDWDIDLYGLCDISKEIDPIGYTVMYM